jgi:hypothetical protein
MAVTLISHVWLRTSRAGFRIPAVFYGMLWGVLRYLERGL